MKAQLDLLIGERVNIVAGDDCVDSVGVYLNFIGTLEKPEDGYKRYYVRCKDGYWGTEGVGFHPEQVEEVGKRASGLPQITLKQHLNANYE